MKKYLLIIILSIKMAASYGQFSVYNTRTLYDAFENPAQKAFYADSSMKYAFNFLIPNISINTTVDGPAQTTFKGLIFNSKFNVNGLVLGEGKRNFVNVDENAYIAMYRVFKNVRHHQESGISWQIKTQLSGEITNETLALFNKFNLLPTSANAFNNAFEGMSYHQFGFTFRESVTNRLGLGIKLSYLSGIAYSKLSRTSTAISVDTAAKSYTFQLRGLYRSNFSFTDPQISAAPGFKNPGVALTLSANYKLRNKFFLLANLKDIGFIRWSKDAYSVDLNQPLTFANNASQKIVNERLRNLLTSMTPSPFMSKINGRAEVLLNKDLGLYQPNLLVSKNLFNKGGDVALINTLRRNKLNLSMSTAYNLNNYFQLGGQFMYKTPNSEFFIGSDQVLKTYYTTKGFIKSDENIGRGHTAASFYLGFSLKYGARQERQQNASYIPFSDRDLRPGFFKRLYARVFPRKRYKQKERE